MFICTVAINLGPPLSIGRMRVRGQIQFPLARRFAGSETDRSKSRTRKRICHFRRRVLQQPKAVSSHSPLWARKQFHASAFLRIFLPRTHIRFGMAQPLSMGMRAAAIGLRAWGGRQEAGGCEQLALVRVAAYVASSTKIVYSSERGREKCTI
jgi:hypothetical protein